MCDNHHYSSNGDRRSELAPLIVSTHNTLSVRAAKSSSALLPDSPVITSTC